MIINSKHVGGSGADPVIQPLSVTENGTYTAPEGVDGFNPVTVDVSGGGDDWTLLGVNATKSIDTFMRQHPLPIPQTGFKMLMIKITGTNVQTSGTTTILQYLFPFINGAPFWYDSAHTKLQHIACTQSVIAPDDISTADNWGIRNNDTHTIVDGELHWTTQATYYMAIGNSIYYKWVDWR